MEVKLIKLRVYSNKFPVTLSIYLIFNLLFIALFSKLLLHLIFRVFFNFEVGV